MTDHDDDRLARATAMWTNTGSRRPAFAIESGEGQESVWDYPRPPIVVPDTRLVVVGDPAAPIAETRRARRVCETASPPTVYVPFADIALGRLVVAPGSSVCEWKGVARYWAGADDPSTVIAWDYPSPHARYAALADHLAFYPGRVQCTVDGERVRSQAGDFYGGWITDEIVGPFKGDPGTGGW